MTAMNQDEAVIATNDDATSCKRAAVDRGYWHDPYIKYFVRATERKAPEINRGYYARVKGVHYLLKDFIKKTNRQCQVVNLGAGFDTSYWQLKDEGLNPLSFVEVDFQGVTSRKCHYIKSKKPLLEKLQSEAVEFSRWDMHADDYHIVGADLRKIDQLQEKLHQCQLDKSLPTVFMSECVLVYMPGESTSALLSWIAANFTTVFYINYEQVNMADRFGQVMVENLKTRGCQLASLDHCASLATQKQRCGWTGAEALGMNDIYTRLDQRDVQRIEALEFLDEKEMLVQLFDHYCISWAYKELENDSETSSMVNVLGAKQSEMTCVPADTISGDTLVGNSHADFTATSDDLGDKRTQSDTVCAETETSELNIALKNTDLKISSVRLSTITFAPG